MSGHIGPAGRAPVRFGRTISVRVSGESATLELVAEQDAHGTMWITIQLWRLNAEAAEVLVRLRPSEADELGAGLRRVLSELGLRS